MKIDRRRGAPLDNISREGTIPIKGGIMGIICYQDSDKEKGVGVGEKLAI